MLHQIKAQQFYTDLGILSTVLSPTKNSRIQGLFKAFELLSCTFQGRFNFQVSSLNSSTFQACANPVLKDVHLVSGLKAHQSLYYTLILLQYKTFLNEVIFGRIMINMY